jgi:hypothetical protein
VHDAPFTRRHWVERTGTPTAGNAPGCAAGEAAEHVRSTLPIILDVDDDERFAAKLSADDHADQELERLKRLAAPSDEQSCIVTLDLEDERAVFGVITNIGLRNDAHGGQEVVDHLCDKLFRLGIALKWR